MRENRVLESIMKDNSIDADAAFSDVASGRTLEVVKREHSQYVRSHHVWGTPTFIVDEKSVFVRLLDHAHGNGDIAKRTIDRILDDIDWPILNEFKHTSIPM